MVSGELATRELLTLPDPKGYDPADYFLPGGFAPAGPVSRSPAELRTPHAARAVSLATDGSMPAHSVSPDPRSPWRITVPIDTTSPITIVWACSGDAPVSACPTASSGPVQIP